MERRVGEPGGEVGQVAAYSPTEGPSITVTGVAQQRAWRERALPPVEKVRPGLWSVPTPFHGSPLRYVLAYLVESPRGPVLVDTGCPGEDAWDGLVAGIRETGHDVGDVQAVLVTHFHPDHVGLAYRVREASGAWIGMHELDERALSRFASRAEFVRAERAWLIQRGVPSDEFGSVMPAAHAESPRRAMKVDVLIEGGTMPLGPSAPLRALWTPGHTPGHLCFVDERYNVLLSGDHVLPRISPNISPSAVSADDTLGIYLQSLADLAEVAPEEVLPAHEYRFSGLTARISQLQEHHRARLQEVMTVIAVTPGCTTAEVAERLTWSRPWDQNVGMIRRSALGETYAHLVHLERRGLIVNGAGSSGRGKIDHWQLR